MIIMAEESHNPIRDAAERRIRGLVEEISYTKSHLKSLEKQLAVASGSDSKYYGKRIMNAVHDYLRENGPQEIEVVIEALNALKVAAGKRQAESQVGKSIRRLLRSGSVRQVGNKIEYVPELERQKRTKK